MNNDRMRLSDACRQLGVEYNLLHRAVVAGRVPAERDQTGNRWLIKRNDLPAIARSLGLLEGTRRSSPTVRAHRR